MVCEKCEKKLDKLITPDAWKEGSRNVTGGKDGGRKVGANMLLYKNNSSAQFDPLAQKCKSCKRKVEKNCIYCQYCSYKQGICKMCGVKVLETKFYKQSNL